MDPHLVTERVDDHIVVVTMNRPEIRNALSPEMLTGMTAAWDMIDSDPGIRAAILTGAGGTFMAGADLKRMRVLLDDPKEFLEDADISWSPLLRDRRLTKPLIAAVEGYAVAGGTEILQSTDIRVAGESAKFGLPEVTLGLVPMAGSTVRLRRQIPHTKAMEILLMGHMISAQEALQCGLIGRVVPDGSALEHALEVARIVARNGPLAVQAIKRSAYESDGMPEPAALAQELEIGTPVYLSEDAKEGTQSFAEKRRPTFYGR